MSKMPVSWIAAPLSDICERIVDGSHNPPQATQNGKPMLSARNVIDNRILFKNFRLISDADFALENARTKVAPNDVLLTIVGTIGRTAVVPLSLPPFALQRSVAVLKSKNVGSKYLAYALDSPDRQQWLADSAKGTAQKGVYLKTLGTLEIPLAPAPEQTRIVEKLEELLSDLDAGVAELKAAQKKLAQYRQALLKAAVEGSLTAIWRAARHSAPLPPRGGGVGGEGARAIQLTTPKQQQHARELRSEQTPPEQALWQHLRAKRFADFKFRRQQPLGRYIVDFVCFAKRLIVELDGGQHAEQQDYDATRDAWLRAEGFRVLRIWNSDWHTQQEAALEAIWNALHEPPPPLPNPSPARGEGLERETGAQLLARILTERRKRWEAKQLAKFAEQGKAPPKDWQSKYPEPVTPDSTDLPALPEGWVWASLDMLGEIASGVAKGSKRDEKISVREVPYLRVANVQRGYLDLDEVKTILANERDIDDLTLRYGDVLFNEGGDRDKLGRGWVWRDDVESCIHQNHVFRMRPYLPEIVPELVSHHGNTFGKLWFQSAGKQTTNLASINMGMLRAFPVPLAPAAEQREILLQMELQLDAHMQQQGAVSKTLKQTTAQRKNILKAAFSGQLVQQDPNDEPASVLLARIRVERVAEPTRRAKKLERIKT